MKITGSRIKQFLLLCITMSLIFTSFFCSVSYAKSEVKINNTKAIIYIGSSVRLKLLNNNSSVVWTSTNKKIASVNANGNVIGNNSGNVSIVADSNKRKYTCKVTVKKYVTANDVPVYSGKPYTIINKNEPAFSDKEKKNNSAFEKYSSMDQLGRCGTAFANICKSILPTEKRGSIGLVKPTGWHTVKYDCVDGKYLYNRCHLIAYELAGENANEKNLITGTRYMNTKGMLPFENLVADYVKKTGNHVLYRATPIYSGSNLLASGVQLEGYSVEDKGSGICFNVFCYNVQPDIIISYEDGNSTKNEDSNSSDTGKSTAKPNYKSSLQTNEETYILNTSTKKIHRSSCHSIKQMSDSNKKNWKGNIKDLLDKGYSKCKNCNP